MGNKSFASYMNNTSTILANDSRANQNILKTNVTVLNSIQDYKDSVSGISMDEEASNMMAYMSAYNAASRLMTAMDEALNTLINNTGLVGR
ncbi:MAG: flagellar basal body rod C-terminal domain-containing protein [Enterocloster clostridioformis]